MDNILRMLDKLITWLSLPEMNPMDFVEIILIAVLFYYVIKWIKTTRAWVIVKGLIVLLLVWIAATLFKFDVILWIFTNTIGVGITAVLILFQPELRRVLETLGQRKILPLDFFAENKDKKNEKFSETTLNELVRGTFELAKTKTGALIVLEQEISLTEYAQTGIMVDGLITSQLLINIFEHNTPLHDGAVIVRGDRVVSATCYLPLSGNMRLSKDLGTRHRAGVGISEVSDSFTIIVSEETGKVSIARGGNLIFNVDGDFLRAKLLELQKGREQEVKNKKVFPRLRGKREK
ncbi:MAG: diadenylate cyclase CdaA [Lachnospiraceae bacterium]|nr:diadenylate cyclase CdaA [Lachnospiraceae bacterium]MBP3611245.1 diadenylate cyclase CdaA [Lachnospiraceae bacterium]